MYPYFKNNFLVQGKKFLKFKRYPGAAQIF